jgi:FkbM family methyltransferase
MFNISANPGVPIEVVPYALGERTEAVVLEIDHRDRGGTRTRLKQAADSFDSRIVECRPLLSVLQDRQVSSIDALKIDVEGAEEAILSPFFSTANDDLLPKLLIVEHYPKLWNSDLFESLNKKGYFSTTRTKLNVVMRRLAR